MTETALGSWMDLDDLVLQVEDDPGDDDIACLDDSLRAFTVAAAGHDPPRSLAVFARRDGIVVAGIHGWTWGECCELVSLWVSEPLRRRGLGHTLLAAAEAEARRRRCQQVVLFTHADQAPQLYLRSGYELVGHVRGYPVGSAAYWFRKRLDRPKIPSGAHLLEAALWVGITFLLVIDAIDVIRSLWRRAGHRLAGWWERVERREQRDARRAEMAALAGRIRRDHG
ncbi:MAG TPA: GNAT family N-acetyltransferase [Acidimicrobiales bacterium]|jgi:ribosomal protein S18 acetylase RimI-like enzyme